MSRVLIYGINYSPELTGTGKYTGEMASWLLEHGYEVTVVTAPPYYPEWRVRAGYGEFSDSMESGVRVLRCPLYVPAQPSTIKRLLHLLSFSISSCLALLKLWRLKPDLVIYVVPTLFCALQILLYSRLSGARVVIHVQDFEVDALFGLGMTQGGGGVLARFAYGLERWLMRRFDHVSTISAGMLAKAHAKGVDADRLILFPNWSEVQRFREAERDPSLLIGLGVDPTHRVVLYSGNMGEKQGLELVLEAAQVLSDQELLTFLLVGEGGGKSRLQARAAELGVKNVIFAPLLPYDDLPRLLASADCHLVVQRRGVADAVLPSKLTNILAVGGNAVITADEDTTLGKLCRDFSGIAACVEPESLPALISGIQMALSMPSPNEIAVKYAQDNLDKQTILTRFMSGLIC